MFTSVTSAVILAALALVLVRTVHAETLYTDHLIVGNNRILSCKITNHSSENIRLAEVEYMDYYGRPTAGYDEWCACDGTQLNHCNDIYGFTVPPGGSCSKSEFGSWSGQRVHCSWVFKLPDAKKVKEIVSTLTVYETYPEEKIEASAVGW